MQKPFSHTIKYEEKEEESGWVSLILTASGAVGGQTFSFLYCSRDVYSQGRLSSDVGRGFALFSRKRVFTRHILPPRHVSNGGERVSKSGHGEGGGKRASVGPRRRPTSSEALSLSHLPQHTRKEKGESSKSVSPLSSAFLLSQLCAYLPRVRPPPPFLVRMSVVDVLHFSRQEMYRFIESTINKNV